MFHSGLFGTWFGPQTPNANSLGSPYAADPRMDPRAPLPKGQVSTLGDKSFLSPETRMDALLQELQAAQKREQMMKMFSMVQSMGQSPQPAPAASQGAPIGAGRPGVSRSGGPDPGQQLKGMLAKAGGIGMPGAPLGYPGGVPGAAAGAGASPANMLQQLAMRRMARQRPYGRNLGRRF